MGSLAKKDLYLTSSSFYHEDHGTSSSPSSDQGSYGHEEDNSLMEKNHSSFHGGSLAAADLGFGPHLSLINFKSNETTDCYGHATAAGSLLSFQQERKSMEDDSFMWKDGGGDAAFGNNRYHLREVVSNNDLKISTSESPLIDEINDYQPEISYGWMYSDATVVTADRVQETRAQEGSSSALLKRPHMGDHHGMASSKKQCTGSVSGAKNSKSKPIASNKDPQSLAAKNRRERISERLKVLQELVPNGPKVDLVTMLEKAISYVKFLQLQVKVLATDEFWPAQGGKAPDISQVKEAIDAILASQRERSSSSK